MLLKSTQGVKAVPVGEDAKNTKVRWLISDPDGAPNFAMRLFEIGPHGATPLHAHAWEHEVFVLEGEGIVVGAEGDREMVPGDAIFIPGEELHQFRSSGTGMLKMLCMIPI
ncbi:MAG: cupin domain-containing protein [Candidatus Latescibacterota bacterium]